MLSQSGAGGCDHWSASWRHQRLVKTSCSRLDLPEPETPVMATNMPSGMLTSMFLQVMGARSRISMLLRAGFSAVGGQLDTKFLRKIPPGQRRRDSLDFLECPGRDDVSAVLSGARSKIQNVVGRSHDVGIVLDHQNRVSQIAQVVQDLDQAVGVAAVQADRRLVQNVKRAHQPRAQRRGQLNALRFAAGKRRGQAIEREVFQADIVQKPQASTESLQQLVGDGRFLRAQVAAIGKKSRSLPPRSCADLADVLAVDLDLLSFGTQTRATAVGARRIAAITAQKTRTCSLYFLRSRY